jgi:hypothetical protein
MKRLILAFGLTLGTAYAGPVDQHRPMLAQATPGQGATPEICTEVYQPVCGTNPSGVRTTYSNVCFARAARATNVTPGECANAK